MHPQFLAVLISLICESPDQGEFLQEAAYNLAETLASISHRNQVLLGSTTILKVVLEKFLAKNIQSNSASQKLLKKLLIVGASDDNVRQLFKHSVCEDGESLDTEMLDIIRAGMKGKWPGHFSMENDAAFIFKDENARGLPLTGFTFMVCVSG